ncbi:MAG: hypothetical protein A3C06_03455 [Candidatus Taylorbacteria bacterium RIFCSPHIGHO2_02_FULL_46_13]|uniref:Uncharacterized protein n=1 Tax=Candidatus Taylorbacteria bacterium RIFCSPHIGHO2_02_FULL_46_13 TaxID=1802312 RepID=A0A1G2MX00_9BACT|nr:MAG: hypothetical protein A3C06_03455 [Candidatus Taylorbacteria bacterium RIFCSPHIGHO2_02_FULL_46_13]
MTNKGYYTAGQAPHEKRAVRVLTRGKPRGSKPFVVVARSGEKKKILFLSAYLLGNKSEYSNETGKLIAKGEKPTRGVSQGRSATARG